MLITDGHMPNGVSDRGRAVFDEHELDQLLFAITAINAWNRLAVTARAEPSRYHPSSGFRRPDQVNPILPAAGLELSDEDLAEIEGRSR